VVRQQAEEQGHRDESIARARRVPRTGTATSVLRATHVAAAR